MASYSTLIEKKKQDMIFLGFIFGYNNKETDGVIFPWIPI